MKAYFEAVRRWMLILFMIVLCAAMGTGAGIAIDQAFEGQLAYLLIFIVYPFLIPMVKIAAEAVCKKEEKPKGPVWFDVSPPTHGGARCVPTTSYPVHPPKER